MGQSQKRHWRVRALREVGVRREGVNGREVRDESSEGVRGRRGGGD